LGVERLRAFLRRHRRVALDTSIFIYQLESNPKYLAYTDLVLPYREGDEQQADDFYGLLSTYPNLDWIAPNLEIAELAARIRALHRLRIPDALQAATAEHSLATGLITNDSVFRRVEKFQTLVLDDLL